MTSATAHGVSRKPNKADDDDDDDGDDDEDEDEEVKDVADDDGDEDDGDDEDAATVRKANSASRSVIQSPTAVRSNGGGAALSNARSKPARALM